MLAPTFAGELFGPGQPLDASKYFIILPDAIGAGKSSKPSDGMRAKFPRYNYDDMVLAQYRLVTEGLGIRRLRLVIGNSMGGMHAWLWAVKYPDFMDAVDAPGLPADRDVGPQLDDAAHADRRRPQGPGLEGRRLRTQPRAVRAAAAFWSIVSIGGSQGMRGQRRSVEYCGFFPAARSASLALAARARSLHRLRRGRRLRGRRSPCAPA